MSDPHDTSPSTALAVAPDALDAKLQQLFEQADADAPENRVPVPKKPRWYCAGSKRIDEATGKRYCTYQSYYSWRGYCPACKRPFACLRISNKEKMKLTPPVSLGGATMDQVEDMVYYSTGVTEFDRVLGGGFVLGTTLLLGATRGSGKTTLLLQACEGFAQEARKAYFASGEMTQEMCLYYAKRIGIKNKNIRLYNDPQGLDIDALFEDVLAFGARLLIIDSLQVATVSDVKGDIGNNAMLDAVINMVSSFSQAKKIACVIIGHLGKGGDYLGSSKVQFLVDGLIRMNVKYAGFDDNGEPIDSMVREIAMDGKSRQGRSDIKSLVELTPNGIRPVTARAARLLNRLITER